MNNAIEETRTKINNRILALEERLSTLSYSIDTDEFQPRAIMTESGPLDFYDEIWHLTLELAEKKEYEKSLEEFRETYRRVIDEKADKSDLPEKVDRSYVDSKVTEYTESILSEVQEKLDNDYECIQDQIDQIRNNTEAIKQHFEQNTMSIRRELNSLRKKYEFTEEEKKSSRVKPHPLYSPPPPPRSIGKARSRNDISCVVLGSPPKNRHLSIHTPYKQRTPFKPELPGLVVSTNSLL